MGRTACTEPQCLYKGALYLTSVPVQGCTLPYLLFTSLISAYSVGGRRLFIYTTVSHANAVWQEDCIVGVEIQHKAHIVFLMYYPTLFLEGLRKFENHPIWIVGPNSGLKCGC